MDIVNNSAKLPDLQDIPAYVRPYNYMPSNNVNGYSYYSFASSQRLPTLTFSNPSSPDDLDLDLPPRKKMNCSAQPTYMPHVPPRDLFRPVDFEARHVGAKPLNSGARKPELPYTPSGSSSPDEQKSGTSLVLGKDATYSADGISVCLQEADLWRAFHQEGNEMIVTKPGRRLFPCLVVNLRGLKPEGTYSISLRVQSADKYRYKFLAQRWVSVGESEVLPDEKRMVYCHPNSPKTGAFWMKKPISFKPCKITHNKFSRNGNILLSTMHKYVMEVVVTELAPDERDTTIRLNVTEFVAVTAYQNSRLTQLKIDNNPFAKGFRERDIIPSVYPESVMAAPCLPPTMPPPLSWPTPQPSPLVPLQYDQQQIASQMLTPDGSSLTPSPPLSISPPTIDYIPTYNYSVMARPGSATPPFQSTHAYGDYTGPQTV